MLSFAAFLSVIAPWLNPFNSGPTPSTNPWLLAATCAVLLWTVRDSVSIQMVAGGWLWAAVLSACMGLLQYFGQTDATGIWINHANMGEAYANLRQRNQFATLTSIGLLALIWQVTQIRERIVPGHMASASRNKLRFLLPLCWGLGLIALAMGNAASGSRTGFMQWIAVLVITLLWRRPGIWRPAAVAISGVTAYGISIVGLPWLLNALTGFRSDGLLARFTEEAGCGSRRILWSNVLDLIAQKPWMGWGWGELDFAHFVTLYHGERFCDILDNAHNLPLHLAVELGVPFAVTVCGVALWLSVRAKPWRETEPGRQLAWGVLLVIGLHSLLEYPLWYGPFQTAAILGVGILLGSFRENSLLAPVKSITAASFFIACIAVAAVDYWRVSQLYLPVSERSKRYRDDATDKIQTSLLFENQVQFAEFTTTPLAPENAQRIRSMGEKLLHFSPEPRIVEKLIESNVILGRDDEAAYWLKRYQTAFPEAHSRWATESPGHKTP